MKPGGPLFAVRDMKTSLEFYRDVLGLEVVNDFGAGLGTMKAHPAVELVHPPLEHRWGQRAVRLYDPDRHIIEVGESLAVVCRRFRDSGLNEEGIARRMDVSVEFVREQLKQL